MMLMDALSANFGNTVLKILMVFDKLTNLYQQLMKQFEQYLKRKSSNQLRRLRWLNSKKISKDPLIPYHSLHSSLIVSKNMLENKLSASTSLNKILKSKLSQLLRKCRDQFNKSLRKSHSKNSKKWNKFNQQMNQFK